MLAGLIWRWPPGPDAAAGFGGESAATSPCRWPSQIATVASVQSWPLRRPGKGTGRMGGVEASGRFAYQHAQAVQHALALAEDPSLHYIRVEAENDIVDVEIWSKSGQLVSAFQFKRRNPGDTWGQQELIDELVRWSGIATQNPNATYEFVTDGRLGPTGISVRDALEKASAGDVNDILGLIDGKTKGATVSSDSLRRASVRTEAGGR